MTLGPSVSSDKHQPLPHTAGTLAMWWFLGSLSMLFGAGMLGYIAIRVSRTDDFGIGHITLPGAFWASTVVVLLASFTIQRALSAVRRERLDQLKNWLLVTLGLGMLFCIVQMPSLLSLLDQHWAQMDVAKAAQIEAGDAAPGNRLMPFFGLVFVYVVIHGLHVIGGILHLIWVTVGAMRRRYDHEFHNPVKHAAMYWHFLDVVWIIMFGTMLLFG
jgi:cytochrome c oxidase subunit 3